MVKSMLTLAIFSIYICSCTPKTYKNRCELAHELTTQHKLSQDEASKWTCIADKLNDDLNTNKTGNFLGIFAINRQLWCSDSNETTTTSRCGITCDKLLDDDITDDLLCVRDVINSKSTYRREFEAWPVYETFCEVAWKEITKECFSSGKTKKPGKKKRQRRLVLRGNSIEEDFDVKNTIHITENWDIFGPEPDYLFSKMFSDQPKRLKRIN